MVNEFFMTHIQVEKGLKAEKKKCRVALHKQQFERLIGQPPPPHIETGSHFSAPRLLARGPQKSAKSRSVYCYYKNWN